MWHNMNLFFLLFYSWSAKSLAAAIGLPVDVLTRRINFWVNKVRLRFFVETTNASHSLMKSYITAKSKKAKVT